MGQALLLTLILTFSPAVRQSTGITLIGLNQSALAVQALQQALKIDVRRHRPFTVYLQRLLESLHGQRALVQPDQSDAGRLLDGWRESENQRE